MMLEKHNLLARMLTYGGIIPFCLLVMASAVHVAGFDVHLALITYAAVIIAFIAGIHWAVYLLTAECALPNLLLHSNISTLLGWGAIFIGHYQLTLMLQGICFIYLLYIDFALYRQAIIAKWFFKLRIVASSLVLSLLVVGCCV